MNPPIRPDYLAFLTRMHCVALGTLELRGKAVALRAAVAI